MMYHPTKLKLALEIIAGLKSGFDYWGEFMNVPIPIRPYDQAMFSFRVEQGLKVKQAAVEFIWKHLLR